MSGSETVAGEPSLRIYLINLDRSPDRLARMKPQLDALPFPWTRISAVEGAKFGELPWPDFDDQFYSRRWGIIPGPGAYGCYMSHVHVLRSFLAGSDDLAVILEDDAVLQISFRQAVEDAVANRDLWDVVKLGGHHHGWPATVAKLGGDRRLVTYLQRQTGSVGYIVNRRAAEAYLKQLLPMRVPFDHEFDKAWKYGIRIRAILPAPVTMTGTASTIGGSYYFPGRRAKFNRRLYKLGVEASRLRHYLFSDNSWMRGARRTRNDALPSPPNTP